MHASWLPRPRGEPVPSTNRHPKSFITRITDSVGKNVGGSSGGTPPAFGPLLSHTASLPSPNAREATIWRSGKAVRLGTNVSSPTSFPLGPRAASTTMLNPNPWGRVKIGTPSGLMPDGSRIESSDRVRPKKRITGPGGTVGKRVGVRVRDAVGVAECVAAGVLVAVALRVNSGEEVRVVV